MKRAANAGESIAETLVAVLIMALVFLMLTAAVMASARMNARLRNEDVTFETASNELIADDYPVVITVGGASGTVNAALYKTANGYYYYE